MVKLKYVLVFLISCSVLFGCAAVPTDPDEAELYYQTNDPLEPMNRGIFAFNQMAEKNVLRPVAKGYRFVVPEVVHLFFLILSDLFYSKVLRQQLIFYIQQPVLHSLSSLFQNS